MHYTICVFWEGELPLSRNSFPEPVTKCIIYVVWVLLKHQPAPSSNRKSILIQSLF